MAVKPDRRRVSDRRRKPTNPITRASFFGRRRYHRRKDDTENVPYVDRYSLRAVLTVVAITVLSILDASMTLRLVALGGRELNPVMHFFLELGPLPFIVVKNVLTAGCAVWCLVHKNYRIWGGRVRTSMLLVFILALYGILIMYEVYLLNLAATEAAML